MADPAMASSLRSSEKHRDAALKIVALGWCRRCQRSFGEHDAQPDRHNYDPDLTEPIIAFAARVEAEEREACARIADAAEDEMSRAANDNEAQPDAAFSDARTKWEIVATMAHCAHTAHDIGHEIRQRADATEGQSHRPDASGEAG